MSCYFLMILSYKPSDQLGIGMALNAIYRLCGVKCTTSPTACHELIYASVFTSSMFLTGLNVT